MRDYWDRLDPPVCFALSRQVRSNVGSSCFGLDNAESCSGAEELPCYRYM
jgi:hypothetical protein